MQQDVSCQSDAHGQDNFLKNIGYSHMLHSLCTIYAYSCHRRQTGVQIRCKFSSKFSTTHTAVSILQRYGQSDPGQSKGIGIREGQHHRNLWKDTRIVRSSPFRLVCSVALAGRLCYRVLALFSPHTCSILFMRCRIESLWEEMHVSQRDREEFSRHFFFPESYGNYMIVFKEVSKLLGRRSIHHRVLTYIELREGFLISLAEISRRLNMKCVRHSAAIFVFYRLL